MSFQAESYIQSTPNYNIIVGKFCYPLPFAPGGTISRVASRPKPLIVGTDVSITVDGVDFNITSLTGDHFLNFGVNPGDVIVFNTPQVSGQYAVSSVTSATVIKVNGPAVAITSGTIYFQSKPQPIEGGNGANFNKAKRGDYLVVMSDTLTPTVQVAKISEVTDATHLTVIGGFVGDIDDLPFMICRNQLLGVSINCVGGGVVMGQNVDAGDVLTFYQDSGLEPVYGDSGTSEFKILIQK